uniref:DUF1992 domain-containing protein n=1 Tax=Macrostomum lignano TaxID=282301 RepID=A0A1I8FPD2_9PLAT
MRKSRFARLARRTRRNSIRLPEEKQALFEKQLRCRQAGRSPEFEPEDNPNDAPVWPQVKKAVVKRSICIRAELDAGGGHHAGEDDAENIRSEMAIICEAGATGLLDADGANPESDMSWLTKSKARLCAPWVPGTGLRQVRQLVLDTMQKHPSGLFDQTLMIKQKLREDPRMAGLSWDRFLPKFKPKDA